jgi:hypothetical protein
MVQSTVDETPQASDRWGLLDAVVAIVMGVWTILAVVFRHAFTILAAVVVLAVVGTILGWWTP